MNAPFAGSVMYHSTTRPPAVTTPPSKAYSNRRKPSRMPETLPQTKRRHVLVRLFLEHRFLLLFLFLLANLIAYPYTEHKGLGSYAFRILAALVIALSVFAASFRHGLAVVAVLLAIPSAVEHLVHPNLAAGFFPLLNLTLSLAFDLYIVVGIFRHVFANVRIGTETIFGALCIYILNGMGFASIYGLVSALQPSAFLLSPGVNTHTIPDRFDFIYYSFGVMTQLGAAGMTAVTDQARSISVLEAILGQLYLAVLISRLVGAYRFRPSTADS
jgi:Ion channel